MTPALRALIDAARERIRNIGIGVLGGAVVVVALVIGVSGGAFYRQGPMVLVALLLLVAGAYGLWYRRLDWDRNAVLRALRDDPAKITRASVEAQAGRAALLDECQVTIVAGEAWVMLTFKKRDLGSLALALRATCPGIELVGL
jgi:hypothetical protein